MSKRKWHHPEVPADEPVTTAWRSLGEKTDDATFNNSLEREFPTEAAQMKDESDAEVSRRSFVKIMGASSALAGVGLVSCRRPVEYIAPYAQAPEWVIPGKPLFYASSMPSPEGATPLMVTTYEGRPTKVEPSRLHPDSAGSSAMVQASVLNLYSPARSKYPLHNREQTTLVELEASLLEAVQTAQGGKLGLLIGHNDSPTRTRLIKQLQDRFSGLSVYSYEATREGGALAASSAIGGNTRLVADYSKADRILSIDCDFLGLDNIGPERAFYDRRNPDGANYEDAGSANTADSMNRLYVAESAYTLTGGMADHRLRIKPSQVLAVLSFLAAELNLTGVAPGVPALNDAKLEEWLRVCAADLQNAGASSIVALGSRHSEAAHRLALAINTALGNVGEGRALVPYQVDVPETGSLTDLIADIESGDITALVLTTPSNPVFDAPAELNFADALGKLNYTLHLGERVDHTASACAWHLPQAHYLETWGDARSANGYYSLVQPTIHPLYGGISELELLLAFLSDDTSIPRADLATKKPSGAYTAVRETFAGLSGDAGDSAWNQLQRSGYTEAGRLSIGSVGAGAQSEADRNAATIAREAKVSEGVEVIFAQDYSILDGRYIENGWLQEAPDPITKLTWDNAALVSPQTAKDLGIYDEVIKLQNWRSKSQVDGEGETFRAPIVKITVGGASIEIPTLISFGQADGVIVLPVGYGQGFHKRMRGRDFSSFNADAHAPTDFDVGDVARNAGFDVYPLRSVANSLFAYGATVEPTGNDYKMALTQEHHAMYGRALAREISTMEDPIKGKDFVAQQEQVKTQGMDSHAPENISLYKPKGSSLWHDERKPGYGENLLNDDVFQWEMAVDLSTCNGCSACLVACQAENNIPIVGKQQVAMGREMHWVRMDRYFAAPPVIDDEGNAVMDDHGHPVVDEDNPEMIPQPVACVQCESAPCETVCPVNATVHTEDGLNAMAYNRCIGTRYCANNCPYKARRFNFFDYNKRNPLLEKNLYKGPLGKKQVADPKHLQRNPNVTVRMRGVMEKCTYCVQRLKSARIKAKDARKAAAADGTPSYEAKISPSDLRAPANSVRVACQDACPAGAITFGNRLVGDDETVVRAKKSLRNYDLLNYIGTRPRTSYLARVKNPNPEMPGAAGIGRATIHMH